jgi:hypothetical protein
VKRVLAILTAIICCIAFTALPASAQNPTATPASEIPNSFYNQNVTNWPIDPDSANMVAGFVRSYTDNYGFVGTSGQPIFYAAPGTPNVPVNLQTSGCGGGGGSLNGATSVPIPSYVASGWNNDASSDNPLIIYSPSTNKEYEFWQARYNDFSPGAWSACFAGVMNMATGDGNLPHGGLSATQISYLATDITEEDAEAGVIDHAIAIDVPNCNGGVYPATAHDCQGSPTNWATTAGNSYVSEGSYLRFAPSVNCANYDQTKFENMVCIAGKTYGFVVTDFAGDVQINAEDVYDWSWGGNTGNGPTWGDNSNGGCCIITASGTDPLSVSQTPSGQLQQEYPAANLPWSQVQVIDPPGYTNPETVTANCGSSNGVPVETLTWNSDGDASTLNYTGVGDQEGNNFSGPATSPYQIEYSNGDVSITVNGITSQSVYANCGG